MNGYDDADFPGVSPSAIDYDKINLVYAGTLFNYQHPFVELLFSTLAELDEKTRIKYNIVFVGHITYIEFYDAIIKYGLESQIKIIGYVSHSESIGYLCASSALLFTLPLENTQAYSGKIYEYLGSKKPIICIANPSGAAAKLLKRHGHEKFCVGYDKHLLHDLLQKAIDPNQLIFNPSINVDDPISRKQQAGKLACIIRSVLNIRALT